eukprot:TRINITY_DN23049_c0_g1_i1.p1 TRINITY_DN23049_c0_g1~~TRINITY_DN23049_c0_g1_i1.p1  ORF type:complete len:393 (-),score=113.97 TRINITY_DN23049_c0_g1_i1:139-1317(-)
MEVTPRGAVFVPTLSVESELESQVRDVAAEAEAAEQALASAALHLLPHASAAELLGPMPDAQPLAPRARKRARSNGVDGMPSSPRMKKQYGPYYVCFCGTTASYGPPTGGRERCSTHRIDGDVDKAHRSVCLCGKGASYGPPDSKTRLHCAEHKAPGEVNQVTKQAPLCSAPEGCMRGASFGPPGCDDKLRCRTHKLTSDEYKVHRLSCFCGQVALWGRPEGRKERCTRHRLDGDVNKKNRVCACGKKPSFGFEGGPATACAEHREPGMLKVTPAAKRKAAAAEQQHQLQMQLQYQQHPLSDESAVDLVAALDPHVAAAAAAHAAVTDMAHAHLGPDDVHPHLQHAHLAHTHLTHHGFIEQLVHQATVEADSVLHGGWPAVALEHVHPPPDV